jgi:hypothetical protein
MGIPESAAEAKRFRNPEQPDSKMSPAARNQFGIAHFDVMPDVVDAPGGIAHDSIGRACQLVLHLRPWRLVNLACALHEDAVIGTAHAHIGFLECAHACARRVPASARQNVVRNVTEGSIGLCSSGTTEQVC